MNNIDERAEKNLPGLHEWVDRLLTLANKTLADIQYSDEDHLGFMSLCFLSKQIDHMQSIVTLIPSRDVNLIARSMIEGLFQLLWAAKEPGTFPIQWRAFACIHDWRAMQARVALGETATPEQRTAIENGLLKHGDQFLTKKAREAQKQGNLLPPDPYYPNWRCGQSIQQICESVGGETLYRKLYGPFSDWHHWGVVGFAEVIVRQENGVVYSSMSPTDSAAALACGFQCLLQTIELTDKHLNIGLASKISELQNGYIAWHQKALEN